MNQPVRISHEASSQRQHVRLKTPAIAEVGGRTYRLNNWSVGGLCLEEFDIETAIGALISLIIRFPFEGFEVRFDATISVRHFDPEKKMLGGAFEDISPQRISLLNFVKDSYLAGETVDAGEVLKIMSRDNSAPHRSLKLPEPERSTLGAFLVAMRRNFGLLLLFFATGGLLAYVGFNLYARTFTVAGDGAITSPQAAVLRAPGAGVVIGFAVQPGQRVLPGTLLATLQREDGSVVNINSDCDCIIGENLAEVGAPLAKSSAIMSMAPTTGATRATLIVRIKDIRKVKVKDRAAITFFNDEKVAMGTVESVNLPGLTDPTILQQSGLKVPDLAGSVIVKFDDPVATKRLGQPVSGRVRLYRAIPFIY